MPVSLQLTFRSTESSAAIEKQIRERLAKLELFYDRIISCHVIVQAPHRHHRKGKAYQVRITLGVPGPDIVINHARKGVKAAQPNAQAKAELPESQRLSKDAAHEDLYVALLDAFDTAERKLQDRARSTAVPAKRVECDRRRTNRRGGGLARWKTKIANIQPWL